MSIQKDVVREVRAESALEYAAATIPNKKIHRTKKTIFFQSNQKKNSILITP